MRRWRLECIETRNSVNAALRASKICVAEVSWTTMIYAKGRQAKSVRAVSLAYYDAERYRDMLGSKISKATIINSNCRVGEISLFGESSQFPS